MSKRTLRTAFALAAAGGISVGAAAATASATSASATTASATTASAPPASAGTHGAKGGPASPPTAPYHATTVLNGSSLSHAVGSSTEPLSHPDDIVTLGGRLFVAFQNGVGSTGAPSPTGGSASTLVEVTPAGSVLHQWDLTGKVDGMGADPAHHRILATVNEDGSSSLYTVDPSAASSQVRHYIYNLNPLPHGGGTDALSVYHGQILLSASAPTNPTGPAVYAVALDPGTGTASLRPVFSDDAQAVSATTGAPTTLALTDPDSNAVVPGASPRFPGDFLLDSQGDRQQIFVHNAGGPNQTLTVLGLSQAVDDTAWATAADGVLYLTDATHDTVDAVTGSFRPGQAFVVATPCDANDAPADCASNYLGSLDLADGSVTPVSITGVAPVPHAAVFLDNSTR